MRPRRIGDAPAPDRSGGPAKPPEGTLLSDPQSAHECPRGHAWAIERSPRMGRGKFAILPWDGAGSCRRARILFVGDSRDPRVESGDRARGTKASGPMTY